MATHTSYRTAVYTGVFDPIHLGHFDVIQRGSRLYDRLIVVVGNNPEKQPFFTLEERANLVRDVVAEFEPQDVLQFQAAPRRGLLLQPPSGRRRTG